VTGYVIFAIATVVGGALIGYWCYERLGRRNRRRY
jgi:hypothetical protein